jgi:hypothetical protein
MSKESQHPEFGIVIPTSLTHTAKEDLLEFEVLATSEKVAEEAADAFGKAMGKKIDNSTNTSSQGSVFDMGRGPWRASWTPARDIARAGEVAARKTVRPTKPSQN